MGESGMSKYVISTVEIIKRVYVIEAYSEMEALDKSIEMSPEDAEKVEVLGEMTYSIDDINEYEYNKDWKSETKQKDWINLASGRDRLKGPSLNEIW